MHEVDIVKENLDYILKNGDLFDAICLKEGVKPRKHSFFKLHILFFSRILFGGILAWEKIKSYLAKPEKIKEAQEKIREVLGVNVDIVSYKLNTDKFKISKKQLSILYQEDISNRDNYINNLQKILEFVELYNIKEVLLRKADINDLFVDVNLDSFEISDMLTILGGYIENDLNEEIIVLSSNELRTLINRLILSETDKDFIRYIGSRINDLVIQNALVDFYIDGDIEKLKTTVLNRLALNINSDNTYKDKQNSKVYETVSISGKYVKVLTSNKEGKLLSNTVMSLYDYLGVLNFNNLLLEIDKVRDDKDILLMSTLYLYLCDAKEIDIVNQERTLSFYDKVYGRFNAKKNKKIKKVKGIYTKTFKIYQNALKMASAVFVSLGLFIALCYAGWTYEHLYTFIFKDEETDVINSIIENIILVYQYSYEFEKQFITDGLNGAKNVFGNVLNILGSPFTGDKTTNSYNDDIIVGSIKSFNKGNILPRYYAVSYAKDGSYSKGQMNYNMAVPQVDVMEIKNVDALFSVTYKVGRNDLNNWFSNNEINLLTLLYPLGDNYVLNKVTIWDENDKSKFFMIDYDRVLSNGKMITQDEKNFILAMEAPIITCTYGISETIENSFVSDAEKTGSYSSLEYSEVRNAIIKGLDLNTDASIEDILRAIKSKKYSLTPIKDAGLGIRIKMMNEEKFIETIASLDSLICNLAATLAVEADEDLIYVVGYMNNDGNNNLSRKESHAWAIDPKGDIIDVTPYNIVQTEEDNIIRSIFIFGLESGISIFTIMALINVIFKKIFGHNIIFTIEAVKVDKLLNSPNIEESYAKIKEVLYGGINMPKKYELSDFIDVINKEFASFSKEELRDLKKLLKEKRNEDKTLFDNSCRLVQEMPFLRENGSELKRILEKNK